MADSPIPTDFDLIKLARSGDAVAFGDLYERYAGNIFRFLLANLHNQLDAEDLTSEVFLRAWRSLPRYSERGFPFSAFLFRIARNLLVDRYRGSHAVEPLPEGTPPKAVWEPDTADVSVASQERLKLHRYLGLVRPDYRMVLILRFLNELSTKETAQIMDRSVGAIRVLQFRALSALRELISQGDEL
jgi:RNA polymerase sigma-70 factor (ECF subfamily)